MTRARPGACFIERFAARVDLSAAVASELPDSPRFGGGACERAMADFLREK